MSNVALPEEPHEPNTMTDTLNVPIEPLRPRETVQKLLLSSTCRFIGEYEQPGVLLAQAWPGFRDRAGAIRMDEGPLSRNAFVLCFESPSTEKAVGVVLPDYSQIGEVMASLMSVLYGKRFDSHGVIESNGFFSLPDTNVFSSICDAALPHNSHRERANFAIKLDIREAGRVITFFTHKRANERFAQTFETACAFYSRSLRACENDPEVAYLHLITAGEILASYFERDQNDLLDESMQDALNAIASGLPNGDKIVKTIRGRLFQIKRRFVKAFTELVTTDFFAKSESSQVFATLHADTFEQRMAAAYDLRSQFVHTGIHFGTWIGPRGNNTSEVQSGTPVVSNREFAKTLATAPTFIGLERTVRFALLRFAATEGREVFPDLKLEQDGVTT
ncbi:HEPN domain-containing protein [Paraburkholderia caribensis]|uniref:HEPN domain-containing protein n=1 Tax=Paraburkholderia caribensis TaxID=75105 RepID=UPI00159261B5|nr:HEPN domain-containing protein [Paraburkholderia caribensis]